MNASETGIEAPGLSTSQIWADVVEHFRTPLYANGYFLLLSAASSSGLGFIYWILAAHLYGSRAVGLGAAAISALLFLTGISQLSLPGAVVRFLPRAGSVSARFVVAAYLVSALLAIGAGACFLAGIGLWSPQLGLFTRTPGVIILFLFAIAVWSIFSLQDSVLTGLRRAVWVPVENVISSVIKIGLLVVLAKQLPQQGIFASWTIAAAVTILPISLLLFRRLIPQHRRQVPSKPDEAPHAGQIGRYLAGNYVGVLFGLASTALLPLLVTRESGLTANAYFYQPWLIFYALQVIGQNMTMSLIVEGALDPRNLEINAKRLLAQVMRLVVPAAVILFVASPYVLRVFGAQYASHGELLLRLLALAAVPNAAILVYLSVLRVQQRNAAVAVVQASLALMVVGLSGVLLPTHGINGVGVATLVAEMAVILIVGGAVLRAKWVPGLTHVFGLGSESRQQD